MNDNSELTVVIIPIVGGKALSDCLDAVMAMPVRCLVVLREPAQTVSAWAQYPGVTFVEAAKQSVPFRRWLGVEAAKSGLIALLEDTTLPDPGWNAAVCAALADPRVGAVGGPVQIAPSLGSRFQALGCTEYGRFHPKRFPRLALGKADEHGIQPVSRLPGNNIAYRRAPLLKALQKECTGLIEGDVNNILQQNGLDLVLHPKMSVRYVAADRHSARLITRLQHGRLYASGRSDSCGWSGHLALFMKSMLLPLVLSVRSLATLPDVIHPGARSKVAFWVCWMECAWALGEAVGYLAGAGRSLERWR